MWEVKLDDLIVTGQTNAHNRGVIHLSPEHTDLRFNIRVNFDGKGIVAVKEELQRIYEKEGFWIHMLHTKEKSHVTWTHPMLNSNDLFV